MDVAVRVVGAEGVEVAEDAVAPRGEDAELQPRERRGRHRVQVAAGAAEGEQRGHGQLGHDGVHELRRERGEGGGHDAGGG